MFALVDCNNFYAFCEQLFDPALSGRPVVVLSNNDGCVVSRSAEARALGVPMAAPWHQIKDQARRDGIVPRSSNYAIYADMSNRFAEILGQFSPSLEAYSIDECFLDLAGLADEAEALGRAIRERVAQWLGLAVCVGIGPSKTLAKLANHCAKKALANRGGVCDLSRLPRRDQDALFERIAVGEVWGVGRQNRSLLEELGIRTVRQLRDADPASIRAHFSVVLERTVRELRGESCLALEEIAPDRRQIMVSRSFGVAVYEQIELGEAVAHHIARAAEKLRAQRSLAGAVHVHIRTSPFRTPPYQRSLTLPLPDSTDDTRVLTAWALTALKRIYRPGFAYQKAAVMLTELVPRGARQGGLFEAADDGRVDALMSTLDAINRRWGRGTVQLSVEGLTQDWAMRREHLSPACTSDWAQLLKVRAA